jgi:hypothetical protein
MMCLGHGQSTAIRHVRAVVSIRTINVRPPLRSDIPCNSAFRWNIRFSSLTVLVSTKHSYVVPILCSFRIEETVDARVLSMTAESNMIDNINSVGLAAETGLGTGAPVSLSL